MSSGEANQLLMFGTQALITIILLLGLFRMRSRLGLSPLYVTLGVFQPIQVLLASSIYVEIRPDLMISPGSTVMFTASLFAVLVVYIFEDAIEARKVIYGIMAANLTMTLLMLVFGAQLNLPGTLNFLGLPQEIFNQGGRVMFVGTIALFADVLLIIFVFEVISRFISKRPFVRIVLTMAIIVIFDTLVFATGTFWGQSNYEAIVLSGIVGKVGITCFYSAALALYLRFIEPIESTGSSDSQPFQDIFYALSYREKYRVQKNFAKKAIQKSEAFAQSILNSLGAHIAVLDEHGKIIAVNEAWQNFARLNGGDESENISIGADYFSVCQRASLLQPDESAAAALEGITTVMNGMQPFFFLEYPCHSPTENRWFVMKVEQLRDMPSRVVIAHENITALKQAEMALRQRSRELTALNKVSIQISQSLSVEKVVSQALAGLLQATEASAAFLLMKKEETLIPAGIVFSDPDRTFAEFPIHKLGECLCGMAVSERRSIFSLDIFTDQRCTWEECKQAGLHSAAALPLFSGSDVIAVLGLGTDTVNDFEEQAEYLETLASAVALGLQNALLFEQIQQHASKLEEEVRRRTLELKNSQKTLICLLEDVKQAKDQLETANQKLLELDRLKSMFIASMSHELRTPLNSIIGFTGILLQGLAGDLNDEQQDQLSRVSRAGKHLLALITDVIDVSKIEAGKVDLYPEWFDVGDLINDAITAVKAEAEAKRLSLTAVIHKAIPVCTDRRRLLQCVMNLLSNAVKYSEKGTISVTVKKTDNQIEIHVADSGIGIAESDLPLLFSSFVRLESHLKTKTSGTGLGLYLTRKIVTELLGGTISIESKLDHGSTFKLTLPIETACDQGAYEY